METTIAILTVALIFAIGFIIERIRLDRIPKRIEKKRLEEEANAKRIKDNEEYMKRIWEARQESSIAYFQSRCETFERLFTGKDALEPTEAQINQYMADKAKLVEYKTNTNELFKHMWNKYD